uniref:Uncharacterized protein n=1 Tax=Anguilla anguilla TaxID=7936 RepID=A0A0E9X8B2_ANGAN
MPYDKQHSQTAVRMSLQNQHCGTLRSSGLWQKHQLSCSSAVIYTYIIVLLLDSPTLQSAQSALLYLRFQATQFPPNTMVLRKTNVCSVHA